MGKVDKNRLIWIIVIIAIGCVIYFIYQFNFSITGNVVSGVIGQTISENVERITSEKTIELFFYDIQTNCTLDGEVFVGTDYLGMSEGGIVLLNEETYLDKFFNGVEVSIKGVTDECFNRDVDLPFIEYWDVPNLDYYFENDETLPFEAEVIPRQPYYYEEMQGFVRPEETRDYLEKNIAKYFETDEYEKNLDRIAGHTIRYRSDSLLFGMEEYWQTPSESLNKGHGDCEDWAVTTLSLMRAYNSSIECYNSLWQTHVSIICFIDNSMIIYDQGNVKSKTTLSPKLSEQEKKRKVRSARNNYFDEYGIKPKDRMLYALFSEEDLIIFETEEDFVEWVVNK